jgi:hypothetical protein
MSGGADTVETAVLRMCAGMLWCGCCADSTHTACTSSVSLLEYIPDTLHHTTPMQVCVCTGVMTAGASHGAAADSHWQQLRSTLHKAGVAENLDANAL